MARTCLWGGFWAFVVVGCVSTPPYRAPSSTAHISFRPVLERFDLRRLHGALDPALEQSVQHRRLFKPGPDSIQDFQNFVRLHSLESGCEAYIDDAFVESTFTSKKVLERLAEFESRFDLVMDNATNSLPPVPTDRAEEISRFLSSVQESGGRGGLYRELASRALAIYEKLNNSEKRVFLIQLAGLRTWHALHAETIYRVRFANSANVGSLEFEGSQELSSAERREKALEFSYYSLVKDLTGNPAEIRNVGDAMDAISYFSWSMAEKTDDLPWKEAALIRAGLGLGRD
jgi:hypothetical protein